LKPMENDQISEDLRLQLCQITDHMAKINKNFIEAKNPENHKKKHGLEDFKRENLHKEKIESIKQIGFKSQFNLKNTTPDPSFLDRNDSESSKKYQNVIDKIMINQMKKNEYYSKIC
jgi:hypothetical protein